MFRLLLISISSMVLLSACASGTFKARQEMRERMAASSGFYCEFINGDAHPDVDVEVNMQLAKRCDSTRPFSITNYKNASDQIGVMYCCSMMGHSSQAVVRRSESHAVAAKPAAATPAKSDAPAAPEEEDTASE